MTDPRIGTEIGGCRIERLIGRGGMGIVYQAEQLRLGRQVALKLILPDLAFDDQFRQRFQRESRLAASLDHPSVVPIHEAGEEDGALFIVMRLVHGTDLRARLDSGGPLPPAEAASVVAQVAGALDAAHARGLVHRDVKPANVLLEEHGDGPAAFLSDFGLAKLASSTSGLTRTTQRVGTIPYAAPEQFQGGQVDARSDIYALGCVLYEALTGQVPFDRDTDAAMLWAHVNDPPPRPSETTPGVPASLDQVVARALAKDPADRYPSAGDLGRAAAAAVTRHAVTVPERSVATGDAAPAGPAGATVIDDGHGPRRPPHAPAEPARTRLDARPAPEGKQARGSNMPIIVAGCVLALLVGGAAALAASGGIDLSGSSGDTVATAGGATTAGATETVTAPATTAPQPTTPAPAGDVPYTAEGYEAEYPAGWRIETDDEQVSTYRETKFVSPDGRSFVKINRIPGEALTPAEKASEVQAALQSAPSYREISFEPATINGQDAWRWVFEQDTDGRTERRVDLFLNAGGDGYAVLGGGQDFAAVAPIAERVAASITPSG